MTSTVVTARFGHAYLRPEFMLPFIPPKPLRWWERVEIAVRTTLWYGLVLLAPSLPLIGALFGYAGMMLLLTGHLPVWMVAK